MPAMSAARTRKERSDDSRKPAKRRPRRASAKPAHEFTDDSRGPRLQKVLAEAGVGSRRACEELIESGAVRVNGHVVSTLPAWVDPHKDHVSVNGRHIRTAQPHVYIMLFKPRGVVSTNSDPEGRPLAIDLVKHPSRARLYPVGRLDMESSGLLVLTNDGELANRLTHPRHEVHKSYQVSIEGSLSDDDVRKLEQGLFLATPRVGRLKAAAGAAAKKTAESRVSVVKRDRDRTLVKMRLGEGQNRQIRRMMARLGYKVRKLRRVQMGPLKLKGLQPGQWRELTYKELRDLKKAAGLKEA
jgi:pseudouridine synthase